MFLSVIYSFPVGVEIFPIGLKMTPSAKQKSALRCKNSARLVTLGYSALTQHRDLKALFQNESKLSLLSPAKTIRPSHCCCQSLQKEGNWGLKNWLKTGKEGYMKGSAAKQRLPRSYALQEMCIFLERIIVCCSWEQLGQPRQKEMLSGNGYQQTI